MPRYFFHSEDGYFVTDPEGTELADAATARAEAVMLSGRLLAERPQELWETTRWRLLVTDETRKVLFTIEVSTVIGTDVIPWARAANR